MWKLTTLLVVPILVGVVVAWMFGTDAPEAATWIVLPILVGGVAGGVIPDAWWAIFLVFGLAVGGVLILAISPIDDDVPRWIGPAFVVWMAAVGVAVGLSLRVIAARLEHRGSS